ncbi:hypothetical protein MUP38_00370, partial [Candidatus Bathyarchaeota archaeon]|nr:hypothetical protein [Candidatus Bathyarchaeota archaeon]
MAIEKNCVICKRIIASEVFRYGHLIFDSKGFSRASIHNLLVDALTLIRQADQIHREVFCGRSKRSLLGGLFYILSFKHKIRVT